MRIIVRTTSRLERFLPTGRMDSLVELDAADGATAFDVMEQLGLPDERGYCVILNGDIVPDARRRSTALSDNDELTILPRPRVG
jgi:sulfur carrier protein ThiS